MRKVGDKVYIALARDKDQPDYILPKGGVDKGESLLEAAKREIEEEAGFTQLETLADLGTLERLNFAKSRWICTHYFLFLTHQVEVKPTETARHVEPHWFDIEVLPPLLWPEQQKLIEDKREMIIQKLAQLDQNVLR